MEDLTKLKILEHAKKEFPKECCGLIFIKKGKETYYPCNNLSADPNGFILDSKDYVEASLLGEIVSIVHSHCNQRAAPSQIDLVSCETSKLPWHIISIPNEEWAYLEPKGYKAPLIGRHYKYAILDCYTLVVDWYREHMGISLTEHLDRPDNWWNEGKSLFMDKFKEEGFQIIEGTLAQGDVLLLQIGANVPNHVAVYLEPNLILHHQSGRLSTRDVYGGYYRKHTRCVVRYIGENKV